MNRITQSWNSISGPRAASKGGFPNYMKKQEIYTWWGWYDPCFLHSGNKLCRSAERGNKEKMVVSISKLLNVKGLLATIALGVFGSTQLLACPPQAPAPASPEKQSVAEAAPTEGAPQPPSGPSKSNSTANEKSAAKSAANPKDQPTAPPEVDPETFRIGVDDELQISVWHEAELSMPVTVRPDGMITLPLLNDLSVLGLTTRELQNLLTEKLKPFVTEPQVTVSARAIRSRKVYLVGQVPRPGTYQLSGRKTILQMIAEAGGLNLFAKRTAIYILRNENGHEARIPFNYKNAIKGGSDAEILLLPGDMVVVP
jgi:polysaccharide biosynthesis/export protein